MIFPEKLQVLRKSKGLTQEELAVRLNVSRQAVAKWETGQGYPDIENLIRLSNFMNVTVDYLVKTQECNIDFSDTKVDDISQLIAFRLEANQNTYAADMNKYMSTRPNSQDYRYSNGDYMYHDTYVGGQCFAGQEAVWKSNKPIYAMNYIGRVLDERFSGRFLKDALKAADMKMPYRGPSLYQAGEYIYQSKVAGDFHWFQGYEEIFCNEIKVYECYFHGGMVK
ncbi:MAG: DUF5680 domain-containing protein [Oscillospiraceae bacterium]|nr:DUF5680 domain-containing protein [Oscillospiraceae bacterium]